MSSPETGRRRVELALVGLHCAACVATVEDALRRVPGVLAASVNPATERATVWLADPAEQPVAQALIRAVVDAGYQARLVDLTAPGRWADVDQGADLRRQRRRLTVAVLLGLPVVTAHFAKGAPAGWLPEWFVAGCGLLGWWGVQAALTLGVFVLGAGSMLAGAGRALLAGRANMDLLVSLGALSALLSSLVGATTGAHEFVLFHAAVMIVLFVSVGKYFEARARRQASGALRTLFSRLPQTALRLVDGRLETVPIDLVQPGDRLRVPPGSAVPVDGEVTAGQATLDESMLTGESIPVERSRGQLVLGGTRVVEGWLEVRATATGRQSAAARIGRLVEQAQASKPPWQRLADRLAAVFVPAVIVLAGATFVGWVWVGQAQTSWALQRAIAVLVVACPCALGLAIPTAVLVGTTRAAESGILVRDAAALEAAGQVREVVLDKTGTLTVGRPALARVRLCGAADEASVLVAAGSAERYSDHPFAQALVRAAQQRGLTVAEPEGLLSRPGGGVRGVVNGDQVVVGSAAWLRANGVATAAYEEQADALSAEGFSVVWVALGGRVAALLGLADLLHPESASAVRALHELGVRARILSGDRHAVVSHVAGELGISFYEAQLTPEQKLVRIRQLVAEGRKVAMIGDGVNDAPALAAADVGIAIGTGADVAREAADICLVGHSPRLIAQTIRISRRSARIMRENLFWALFYNLVMLPVAAFAPLPPALATAAMMCSSLSVVGNSLRLRRAV